MRRILMLSLVFLFSFTAAEPSAADAIFMVSELDNQGTSSHQSLDTTLFADGTDPVLSHLLLNNPTDPGVAQLLWVSRDTPAAWTLGADDNDFMFVEHAKLPEASSIEYRIYLHQYDVEVQLLRHTRTSDDLKIDLNAIDQLIVGQYTVKAIVNVPGRSNLTVSQRLNVIDDPENPGAVPAQPVAGDGPSIRFIDQPLFYVKGSGVSLRYDVDNLPANWDVLGLAWSEEQFKMVPGFGGATDAAPWTLTSERLELLPAGMIELQLILRDNTFGKQAKITHRMLVIDPAAVPVEPAPIQDDAPATPTTNPQPGSDAGAPPLTPDIAPDTVGQAIGFTVLAQSEDTQVIYVSNSQGNDENDGLTELTPVKTLAKGSSLLRNGQPDWMLLKAGDVWNNEHLDGFDKAGTNINQPMVIGVYGDGPRPIIIPPHESNGIKITNDHIKGLVIQGLHIYAATRDPGSPRYINRHAEADGINARLGGNDGMYMEGLIIEDCKISHFDANIRIVDDWARKQGEGIPGRIQCTLRRNIIQFASGGDSHSIGIYVEGTRDSVIEQNLIDHNGWAQTDSVSQRNKRSHNIYAQSFNGPIVIRHNIITRGAAHGLQLRAGGDIENNLFARNALAFFTAIGNSKANYNVVLESDDINPAVPQDRRGMGITGWDMNRYEVIGNIVAHRKGSLQRPGIEVSADTLIIKDNIVYKWENKHDGTSIQYAAQKSTVTGNHAPEYEIGEAPNYADPNRNIDSYAGSIGLEPTFEAFLNAAANRPRGLWVEAYDPDTVNSYIRNGFVITAE